MAQRSITAWGSASFSGACNASPPDQPHTAINYGGGVVVVFVVFVVVVAGGSGVTGPVVLSVVVVVVLGGGPPLHAASKPRPPSSATPASSRHAVLSYVIAKILKALSLSSSGCSKRKAAPAGSSCWLMCCCCRTHTHCHKWSFWKTRYHPCHHQSFASRWCSESPQVVQQSQARRRLLSNCYRSPWTAQRQHLTPKTARKRSPKDIFS